MTMNSPEGLKQLYDLATEKSKDKKQSVETAELMREVGLKCIGFNGVRSVTVTPPFHSEVPSSNFPSYQVPRTINCLGAFRSSLPSEIVSSLSTTPTRQSSPQNINSILARGSSLWSSIYRPFDSKLFSKLADSHPDLPVFIVNHEYGALFSDPPELDQKNNGAKVGRVLTSVVAVACLRAQTGVGPQVTSHVFGLRKAFEDGSAKGEDVVEGGEWLASEEGNVWLLQAIDRIVEALGEGKGTTFAPGMEGIKSKL